MNFGELQGHGVASSPWRGAEMNSRPAAGQVQRERSQQILLRRCLSNALCTGVLVKALLGHAIEGEGGDGALQARRNTGDSAMPLHLHPRKPQSRALVWERLAPRLRILFLAEGGFAFCASFFDSRTTSA